MVRGLVVISFRYHLVTIVAVFLALGLGVLAGTTVIDQQLVQGLKDQIERSNGDEVRLTHELQIAQGKAQRQGQLLEELLARDLTERLVGNKVVVLTADGTESAMIDRTRTALQSAGAQVSGVFSLSKRIFAPTARKQLEETVPGAGADVGHAVATTLVRRLVDGPPGGADPLFGLLSDGFIVPQGSTAVRQDDLAAIGGPSQVVVVVGGPSDVQAVEAVLVPMTVGLVDGGLTVAAGESSSATDPLVRALRSDPAVQGHIVTVDDLDEPSGEYALILGLQQLLAGRSGGEFGFKDGSTALFPTG